MENLDELDNYLDRCQVLNFNQVEINPVNSPIIPKEIEAVIKSSPLKKKKKKKTQTRKASPMNYTVADPGGG